MIRLALVLALAGCASLDRAYLMSEGRHHPCAQVCAVVSPLASAQLLGPNACRCDGPAGIEKWSQPIGAVVYFWLADGDPPVEALRPDAHGRLTRVPYVGEIVSRVSGARYRFTW